MASHGLRLTRIGGQNYNEAFVRRHSGNYHGLLRSHMVLLRFAASVWDSKGEAKTALD
jgi:hypothetical protein